MTRCPTQRHQRCWLGSSVTLANSSTSSIPSRDKRRASLTKAGTDKLPCLQVSHGSSQSLLGHFARRSCPPCWPPARASECKDGSASVRVIQSTSYSHLLHETVISPSRLQDITLTWSLYGRTLWQQASISPAAQHERVQRAGCVVVSQQCRSVGTCPFLLARACQRISTVIGIGSQPDWKERTIPERWGHILEQHLQDR